MENINNTDLKIKMNPNISTFKRDGKTKIEDYWNKTFDIANEDVLNNREFNLPLARIKRLMKVEEEVKMVATEVPILFSKVTEKFIEDLTLRAWFNTEESNRRILQKNDLCNAVKTSDMFDFLIYIIPRSDIVTGYDNVASVMPNEPGDVSHLRSNRTTSHTIEIDSDDLDQ